MDDALNDRLKPHAEALAGFLYPDAVPDGMALVSGDVRVFIAGMGKGRAHIGGEWRSLLELVKHRHPTSWEGFLADFLNTVEDGEATALPEPAQGSGEPEPEAMRSAEPPADAPVERSPVERSPAMRPAAQRTEAHRLLPQSPDAEKGLICSWLLDPYNVAKLCRERGLTGAMFHLPSHRMLFEALAWLSGEGALLGDGSDFIRLTEHLQSNGQLAECGGSAEVTGLFMFLPTAANSGYFVDLLLEKHAARQIIDTCSTFAARAYDEAAVGDLLGELGQKIAEVAASRGEKAMSDLLAGRAFDVSNPPPEPPPVLMLGEWVIATPENFVVIQAKVKAGKSATVGAILASTMTPEGDCLGFVSPNPRGHAVLHFDTEQSRYHHHMVLVRSMKRAGRTVPPRWLSSYYVKGISIEQRLGVLRSELARARRECGGVHMAVLDGIADYCSDVNDPLETVALVGLIERLAVEYATVFVLVIHENPGSEIGKTRGHLGSHLERKAETPLRLEKDAEGVTVMYADRARACHIPKDKGIRFAWDEASAMHRLLTDEQVASSAVRDDKRKTGGRRINARVTKAKAALGRFFAAGSVRRSLLAATSGLKGGTFNDYWQSLKDGELILHSTILKGMFEASAEWEKELKEDFPDE
jgi:DnaB-like helicase N terminal domain